MKTRLVILLVVVLMMLVVYGLIHQSGLVEFMQQGSAVKIWLQQQGAVGPLLIILLMVVAITMSPIPSAPIALAAGAIYGHTFGTLYIVVGSVLGSTLAFHISRITGLDIARGWPGHISWKKFASSQNALMGVVFFSRLMPFISFDMVSYAAGLTRLSFPRFALATTAGIVPASFVLAHLGGELSSGEGERIALSILVLGLLPLAVILLHRLFRGHAK